MSVGRRRRFFGDSDRRAFYEAIRAIREACIEVGRKAPIGRLDYRTAAQLKDRIDDAVEALTGDRTALWLKQHGASVPEPPVLPYPVGKEPKP